mmetsp:Transcript_10691/g.39244  ORF Transcript_10691/g.39244 Transcript_10691/m.39244 type:complete len:298 (+) Transcript_10691:3920-4813(+)
MGNGASQASRSASGPEVRPEAGDEQPGKPGAPSAAPDAAASSNLQHSDSLASLGGVPWCPSRTPAPSFAFSPSRRGGTECHRELTLTEPEDVPAWVCELENSSQWERVRFREWEDHDWRAQNGWMGSDYCHAPNSHVFINAYWWNARDFVLEGVVKYTAGAESHRGFCHGGSMCAAMDDLVGWTAFVAAKGVAGEGTGWIGYTVQVNTTLCRPVPVGTLCKLKGWVHEWDRRKLWIHGKLLGHNPGGCGEGEWVEYCRVVGLSIINKEYITDATVVRNKALFDDIVCERNRALEVSL